MPIPKPTVFIVLVTAIVASVFYYKYRHTKLKYFLFFLWYVFISEFTGHIYGFIYKKSTIQIGNIYVLVSILFYINLYKNLIHEKTKKTIFNWFSIIFILFYLIDIYFSKGFVTKSYILGTILLVATIIIYLFDILNSDLVFKFKRNLVFWISSGVLLFHIGFLPIIIIGRINNYNGIYDTIVPILSLIMYGSFVFGFIWTKKGYKY